MDTHQQPSIQRPLRRAVLLTTVLVTLLCSLLFARPANAQPRGAVAGRVVDARADAPLEGVNVYLQDTHRGATTDAEGRYRIGALPPGEYVLVARYLGFTMHRATVEIAAGDTVRHDVALIERPIALGDVVVTATREEQERADISATVHAVSGAALKEAKPAHPSEILSRMPGVWVNQTSGEGHMTAIRQPLTTNPVYLYLEDGVPTRSTGFFNHNALYEINLPMADNVEVMKGPGTALYGSDAIGGVINVTTQAPPDEPAAGGVLEGGSHGFGRALLTGGTTAGAHGVRFDANATRSDGWRRDTEYARQSLTARWDWLVRDDALLKTVATFSHVDQEPAGSSQLSEADYRDHPARNYTPISYRNVRAYRVSTSYEQYAGPAYLSVTPYVRYNTMDMLPNWSLTYDPSVQQTEHYSVGMLAKYRYDVDRLRTRLVTGVDLDYSPGAQYEERVEPERAGPVFTGYRTAGAIYDYDVTFRQASPYLHVEAAPTERVRVNGGLRLDLLGYDYANHLGEMTTGPHKRPASTEVHYRHLSPKLGATFRLTPGVNVFAAYAHAFRVPSQDQLFRSGPTDDTVHLEPVKADNLEVGVRARLSPRLQAEASAYRLVKTDDIVDYVHPDGTRESLNAGETRHRGIEAAWAMRPVDAVTIRGSFSYAEHTYERWQPEATVDYSGNEMETAPNVMATVEASVAPPWLGGGKLTAEWRRLGAYWMDAANTERYDGHDLFGLRASYPLGASFRLFASLHNVADARYAERATYNAFRGAELAPGAPRTLRLGLQYNWQ